jgi:lysophospholipase L1-like esterase
MTKPLTTTPASRSRSARMRPATILLIVAVALVASACRPTYTGPQGPKVAVIGDSITNSSSEELDAELAAKYRFASGIDGIDLADGRAKLVNPVAETKPSVLVIELGINSARESWDSSDLPHLEAVLAAAKATPCVIWVTPTALEPSYYDHLGQGTLASRITAFQASLDKRLPKYPNIHRADFGAIEQQHPEWFVNDRLHLTAAGQAAYAAYVADQVDASC